MNSHDSDSVNDLPDTGQGDDAHDPHLSGLIKSLVERLATLGRLTQEATDLADHIPALSSAFTLEQHAAVAVALRECRDVVSHAKTRLTAAELGNNEWFAARISAEYGDGPYKTETHSFKPSAKGNYTVPNQRTKPVEFDAVMKWLSGLDILPKPIIEVAFDGTVVCTNFDAVCEAVREDGGRLHEYVGEFLVPAVRITKRR